MPLGHFAKNNPGALGELQHNQQESAPRSPRKARDGHDRSRSPSKGANMGTTSGPSPIKNGAQHGKARDPSPTKPKKTKSGTNLAGFLSRPKSLKNLYKLASEEEARLARDKENTTPDEPSLSGPPPPIFAQFTSDTEVRQQRAGRGASIDVGRNTSGDGLEMKGRPGITERPKSFQVPMSHQHQQMRGSSSPTKGRIPTDSLQRTSSDDKAATKSQRGRVRSAFTSLKGHSRSKSAVSSPSVQSLELSLDPKDIDKHLEAMLDRRNIPENQRYKMRNLNDTIKMEFIRQDWAEMQATKSDRAGKLSSDEAVDVGSAVAPDSDVDEEKPKRSRGRSFTFSRAGKRDPSSSNKKQRSDGTLGRHFRSKSTDSVVTDRPSSSGSSSTPNLLAKIKLHQGPNDYVSYLRKVQKPESVEVGKIHKLRLLLRNETVAWIEEFIQLGGMKEVVGLLNRIMDVEWREEHEDALLHEVLLCLKALSTTARAMQHLHTTQAQLFPKLLHMLFDPEKKGPSEFTTRNIITSVLFTYIQSASSGERPSRAASILAHLRDPEPKEEDRPLAFVFEMRQERPYRVWCKEVVSVTKEVFWIFLHNLNVVALAAPDGTSQTASPKGQADAADLSYMARHFPKERPPVPAAPYVGGVEWDATNYLASHLDLLNAILACMPSAAQRNKLRAEFRISGMERCMGSSLRLCKEKFYGSVHDGLRTWVAAAAEDGWAVKDVRYGPPPEVRASPKKRNGDAQQKDDKVDAPRLDMPKLDFELGKPQVSRDAWLS